MTAAILAPHPGTRCKPRPHRRLLARLRTRRQRRQVEAATQASSDDAWAATLHEMNTNAGQAAVEVTEQHPGATYSQWAIVRKQHAVTDGFNQPPAAVQPDRDVPGMEHLARPDWEFATGTWPKYMDGVQ